MRQIIAGVLFIFLFCGTAYSMDWAGAYDNSSQDDIHLDAALQIFAGSDNTYNVDVLAVERSVRHPAACYVNNGIGKELNGELQIYNSKNIHILTLRKDSKGYKIQEVPNIKKLFSYCELDDGKKMKQDKELRSWMSLDPVKLTKIK